MLRCDALVLYKYTLVKKNYTVKYKFIKLCNLISLNILLQLIVQFNLMY
jgi:hypothetical protein